MACSGNQSLVSWILCTHALPLSRFSVFLKVWKILAFAQILSARNKVAFYRHTFGSLATVAWAQKQSHVLNFMPAGFLHLFQENLGLSSQSCWSVVYIPGSRGCPAFVNLQGTAAEGGRAFLLLSCCLPWRWRKKGSSLSPELQLSCWEEAALVQSCLGKR